jgi:zinc and cadmium transporter
LAVTAGFFIYIAASDIIPGIHAQTSHREANIQTSMLLVGVLSVAFATAFIHNFAHV